MSNYLELNQAKEENSISNFYLSNNQGDLYKSLYKVTPKKIRKIISNYPNANYTDLKSKIIKKYYLDNTSEILLGSGSEELIVRINNYLRSNNFSVGITIPNFYRILETAGRYKKIILPHKEKNYLHKAKEVAKKISNLKINALWISNPNLINGKSFLRSGLTSLINNFPNILFIIDEAGIDFLEIKPNKYSLIKESQKLDNLLVIRSFSKMYGLAGIRGGFLSGKRKIIKKLNENSPTFPYTGLAQYFINQMLNKLEKFEKIRIKALKNKKEIEKKLNENNGFQINKSLTNCIYAKHQKLDLNNLLIDLNIIPLNLNNCMGMEGSDYIRLTSHSSKKKFNYLYKKIKSYKKINKYYEKQF